MIETSVMKELKWYWNICKFSNLGYSSYFFFLEDNLLLPVAGMGSYLPPPLTPSLGFGKPFFIGSDHW